jgi:hypothetical protein
MTCHLFLDNFLKFHDLWVVFKGLEFWNRLLFQESSNITTWYHEMFVFSESCLLRKTFYCRNWLCFRACNSRIVTYDQEFCLVVWLMCFNHYHGIFWKVSLKKSWCCRKHVFVFEIVSLKGLNKFLWSNYFFPCGYWVKDFIRRYGKSLKTFPFWEFTFESSLSKRS